MVDGTLQQFYILLNYCSQIRQKLQPAIVVRTRHNLVSCHLKKKKMRLGLCKQERSVNQKIKIVISNLKRKTGDLNLTKIYTYISKLCTVKTVIFNFHRR